MHRKRLHRHEIEGHARYLTFSCHRRLPLLSNEAIKQRFLERFAEASLSTGIAPLAWVVMPEHVHAIVLPMVEGATVPMLLHALKKPFAAAVTRRWKTLHAPILTKIAVERGHRFWQAGGGYDRNVWGDELLEKIRYIHANPIRQGLSKTSIDYPWSSARAYEGLPCIGPPIDFALLPPSDRPLT